MKESKTEKDQTNRRKYEPKIDNNIKIENSRNHNSINEVKNINNSTNVVKIRNTYKLEKINNTKNKDVINDKDKNNNKYNQKTFYRYNIKDNNKDK